MSKILSAILIIIFIGAAFYGIWTFKRWFNYTLGYESDVRSTVCEMVKPEYLKEAC